MTPHDSEKEVRKKATVTPSSKVPYSTGSLGVNLPSRTASPNVQPSTVTERFETSISAFAIVTVPRRVRTNSL